MIGKIVVKLLKPVGEADFHGHAFAANWNGHWYMIDREITLEGGLEPQEIPDAAAKLAEALGFKAFIVEEPFGTV